MNLSHWIVTRFCCGQPDAAFAERRWELFTQFALPSVQAQTRKDFRWLVVVDSRLSQIIERLHGLGIQTVTADEYQRPAICEAIRSRLRNETSDWIVTTRLDSDDALHERHIETLRETLRPSRSLIVPQRGLLYHDGKVMTCVRDYGPFLTLVEPREDGGLSAYQVNCGYPKQYGQVTLLHTLIPMWMQVLHDANRTSRVPPGKHWMPLPAASGFVHQTGGDADR